jgi:hypothetical protein
MSETDNQNLKQEAVPFFARYLEGQINFIEEISEEETQTVAGGTGGKKKFPFNNLTKKAPSDHEDLSGGAIVVTLKHPSDQEDMVVTLKHPSDQEDVLGGGIGVTEKYPSDSDECSVK